MSTLLVHGQDLRCAFCHDPFVPLDAPPVCSSCRVLLHDDCWREAGRCPSLGCRGPSASSRDGSGGVALQAPALHALTLTSWALIGLAIGSLGGPFVYAAVAVFAAALSLAYACRRRASWLLLLSGVGLGVAILVFVQAQKVFLIVD